MVNANTSWQPIATAPRDGTRVLLFGASGAHACAAWVEIVGNVSGWEIGNTDDLCHFLGEIATHWMPLPEPPK